MPSLDDYCHDMVTRAHAAERLRILCDSAPDGVYVLQGGQRYLSFCSNDYLGIAASLKSDSGHNIGAGASRLLSGNHPDYAQAETMLSRMKGTQAALLFGSGYLANLGTIPALVGKDDIVLMDKASHACMIDGVRLSGAAWKRFAHNDMAHLAQLLSKHRSHYRHCLILTETIFSMDGDAAPIGMMAELAQAHDAWLMSDDAHGLGLPQPNNSPAHIQMGTLSKAAGCYGGYVCGSHALIGLLVNHASPLIFSTALPPVILHAIVQSLQILTTQPERAQRVMDYASQVANAIGLAAPSAPIIPIKLGQNEAVMHAQQAIKEHGILVSAIRPPTVPEGTARLRVSLSAAHSQEQIDMLIEVLKQTTL